MAETCFPCSSRMPSVAGRVSTRSGRPERIASPVVPLATGKTPSSATNPPWALSYNVWR